MLSRKLVLPVHLLPVRLYRNPQLANFGDAVAG